MVEEDRTGQDRTEKKRTTKQNKTKQSINAENNIPPNLFLFLRKLEFKKTNRKEMKYDKIELSKL
jgi:hypothetical protein